MQQPKINRIRFRNISVIFAKELRSYFNTPIGYIFLATFSLLMNFLFFYFTRFWDAGVASLDSFFELLKITYLFFIPAITMRLWAEEKKSGTVEMLLTLPFLYSEVILGKFLSALAFLSIALASTLLLPVTVATLAPLDWSLVAGGYLGAFFLGASYIAMGLFISWQTSDQMAAFLVTLVASFFIFMAGYFPVLQLLGPLKETVAFFSLSWHYDSLAIGLVDSRDLLYFVSFSLLFLYLNLRSIEKQR